jgi:hypothetical protein
MDLSSIVEASLSRHPSFYSSGWLFALQPAADVCSPSAKRNPFLRSRPEIYSHFLAMPKPEAFSRVLIDQELRESGWDLLDERRVRFELDGHSGRADYVLSGERGPLCVLEAKRPDLDPYDAKEQARGYAENLRAPFVILSNGKEHWFWNYERADQRPGVFASFYAEMARLHATDAHLGGLMSDFEQAFGSYVRSKQAHDLKTCISKASMYAEGLAAKTHGQSGTLGALCDGLNCWPHATVRDSLKKLYGFCSDYPGIRHAGTPASKLRELECRDAIVLSMLLVSFSGYLSDEVRIEDILVP